MPLRDTHAPAHPTRRNLRRTLALSGVAALATGIAVSAGIAANDDADPAAASASLSAAERPATTAKVTSDLASRERSASRSDRRDAGGTLAEGQKNGGQATGSRKLRDRNPRDIARALLPEYGFAPSEFSCLDALYVSESDWDPHADNPTSSAYGIPQALTGGTHDDLPADYMTNPASQIRWGLSYIKESYGTPCAAWSFKQANNWY